jgi:multidrug efflux pump subunit AcrA (membrane-fusion protein)
MKLTVELTGPQAATLGDRSRAEVSVDAVPGATYPAVLSHVAPKADPLTRKFRVEFHLDNANDLLRAGMFARARIQSAVWTDTLAAPRDAFFRQFGAQFCVVIVEEAEGTPVARLRRVTVQDVPGRMEWVRVTEGLVPGDRIVIKRPRNLKDGTAVSVSVVEPLNVEGPPGS